MAEYVQTNNSKADVQGKLHIHDKYEEKFDFLNLDKSWIAIQKLDFMRQHRRKLWNENIEFKKKAIDLLDKSNNIKYSL